MIDETYSILETPSLDQERDDEGGGEKDEGHNIPKPVDLRERKVKLCSHWR